METNPTETATSRVLFNARLYGWGGREMHLLRLGRVLQEAGAEVHLATRFSRDASPASELATSGVRMLGTPFQKSLSWFRCSTLWAMAFWRFQCRRRSFDTLYSLEAGPFLVWLQRFLKPGGSVIWNPVGPLPEQPQLLHPKVRAAIDLVVVESEWHRAGVSSCFGFDGPVAVAPHLCADIQAPMTPYVVGDGEVRIGYLGRLDSAKGIFRLLDVWPSLQIGKARLKYFGDGPERERLMATIRERGLESSVEVQRTQWSNESELRVIAESIDLAVMPSESEGLPLVLLELLGLGIPYVAFDVGAVHSIATGNPDVRVVAVGTESLRRGTEELVGRIRRREVDYHELRRTFESSFAPVVLNGVWRKMLCGNTR